MKVKVGNKIYDANDEPVMLILTDEDKQLISEMSPTATKYCAFPDGYSQEKVIKWMRGDHASGERARASGCVR